MKSPALILAGCFALGILLAHEAAGPAAFYFAVACCCLTAGLITARSRRQAAAVFALAGFIFTGASGARFFPRRFPADHMSHFGSWGFAIEQPVRLTGRLITPVLLTPYGIQFDLTVSRVSDGAATHRATGKVRIRVLNGRQSGIPAAALKLRYGSSVEVMARLQRPQNYQNPGSFDYRGWLASLQDIYWQGIVPTPALVKTIAGPKPPLARRIIARARRRLSASIDALFPPWSLNGRDGAVLKAVLLGDRSALDSATVESFRISGLYHLLVVAGLHVGLLALLAEGLLRLLRLRRFWRSVLLLILLGIYAGLVEQRAPTLRATLMIGAYLVARLLDREQPALNAIGIAALVLLVYRPAWLFDSGFQLSFAAALLIAGLAVPIVERVTGPARRALWRIREPAIDINFEPRWAQFRLDLRSAAAWLEKHALGPSLAVKATVAPLRAGIWVADLIIFSAVVQLGLLLPMASTFHRVTLAGIGLNALAIPLMTVLLAVAVPAVVLNALWSGLALLLSKLLAAIMGGLFALTELPRLPAWLSFRVPSPPGWVAWGFVFSVVAAALLLPRSRRRFALAIGAAAAFGALIALHPLPPRLSRSALQVTALDCGGGEALFVVFPDRATMLVGAGGGSRRRVGGGDPFRAQRWDPGENIVSPYLWSRGISHLDVFFMPSLRGDRISGVAAVLRNFRVREFWYGALPRPPLGTSLLALCRARGVAVRQVSPGAAISAHGVSISFLGAAPKPGMTRSRVADPGLAARIVSPAGAILLAGNPDRENAGALIRSGERIESAVLTLSRDSALDGSRGIISRIAPKVIIDEALPRQGGETCDVVPPGGLCFDTVRDGAVSVTLRKKGVIVERLAPKWRNSAMQARPQISNLKFQR